MFSEGSIRLIPDCCGALQALRRRTVQVRAIAEPLVKEAELALPYPEVANLQPSAQQAIRDAAAAMAAETPQEREQRLARAKQLGYRTIGMPIPDSINLTNVINSLPKEVRCCVS